MKTAKNLVLTCLLSILMVGMGWAQRSNVQAYNIHEDDVLPSKVAEYEMIIKEFMDNVKKYNIPGLKWITTQTNDFRYLYVSPIANMAAMDDNTFWNTLGEKMGADKMKDMFDRMDKCYDVHSNYILLLDSTLSYMPSGLTQTPAGQDYRRFYYLYATPSNMGKLWESMKAVKDLFQNKGSKMAYRVYRSGYGSHGAYFMVAIAAKDGEAYETMDAANNKLIGTDGDKLFMEMMKYVSKFEEVTGRMRPDLYYSAK